MKHRLWSVSLVLILLLAPQALFAQAFLASHNKAFVDSVMTTIDSNARLVQIRTDSCLGNGSSRSWTYKYRFADTDTLTNYLFHTTLSGAVFDSSNSFRTTGDAFVTLPWIDSDSALTLAEERGGATFRTVHPNSSISASLGQAVVPNGHPLWYVLYDPHDTMVNKLAIQVDATDTALATAPMSPEGRPSAFVLWQNYPNPFNPKTVVSCQWPGVSVIRLAVYDILGREVAVLASGRYPAGKYSFTFDGSNLASGVYFYRLQAGSYVKTMRLLLLR